MLAEMPARLLTEWMLFYGLEPFGERRADLRAGIIAATVANANRSKRQRPYHAEQFMPKLGDDVPAGAGLEEQAPEWETLFEKVRAINAAFGGEDRTQ